MGEKQRGMAGVLHTGMHMGNAHGGGVGRYAQEGEKWGDTHRKERSGEIRTRRREVGRYVQEGEK